MAFTYFFRDKQVLDLIVKHVVPAVRGSRYIDVWDAGCAHGPETYSIAILLRENMSNFLFQNVRIFATDIDTCGRFGPTINEGAYPAKELQRVSSEIKRRYFKGVGRSQEYRVSDEIRSRVSFIQHDLLSLNLARNGLALVVCKNVLLHFRPAERVNVIEMFHGALREGGFLAMENTQKLPEGSGHLFGQVTCEGQIFRKQGARARECVGA